MGVLSTGDGTVKELWDKVCYVRAGEEGYVFRFGAERIGLKALRASVGIIRTLFLL